jgi:hypothetical protein
MHSTRGHRDSPREGLIDRGEYSQRSGGCLEGEERRGKTLSLIIDEVKTGKYMGYLGGLIYFWGCDDSSVCHRGVTASMNIS